MLNLKNVMLNNGEVQYTLNRRKERALMFIMLYLKNARLNIKEVQYTFMVCINGMTWVQVLQLSMGHHFQVVKALIEVELYILNYTMMH
jgi:hypothetical protein